MKLELKVEGSARPDPELVSLLERAQADLEIVLVRAVNSVHTDWTIKQEDHGQLVAVLKLTRNGLSVSKALTREELRDADLLRDRLRLLWGDLIQAELEKIGNELKSIWSTEGVAL